jgi:drug/metabolite transporter (DMT)-like permease
MPGEVMTLASLWAVFTIIAATAQTFRNAAQKALSDRLGKVGATYIRFLFGLPFGLVAVAFLAVAGSDLPRPNATSLQWTVLGALSQIGGTALMLAAMRERSFLVTIAYTHTEPLLVAVFALAFLGEPVTLSLIAAILIATAGVVALSWPSRVGTEIFSLRPAVYGIASGGLFAMAAVGFRGGITALNSTSFLSAATVTLAISLTIQTTLMSCWLLVREPATLKEFFRSWRPSLAAGFLGAFASENWFLAFALTSPARVRTLGLVEILIAAFVSHRLFAQAPSLGDAIGIALIVVGIALLFNN